MLPVEYFWFTSELLDLAGVCLWVLSVKTGGHSVLSKGGVQSSRCRESHSFTRSNEWGSSCGREVMTFWYPEQTETHTLISNYCWVLARKHQLVSKQQLSILLNVFALLFSGMKVCRAFPLTCNYKTISHGSFVFSTGFWLRETADNVRHLLCSHTYFLPVEEAAVPACPLIPSLCRLAGGLHWTHGIFQILPVYHCSCNGRTR